MAFRIKTSETLSQSLHRIASEQVAKALRELEDEGLSNEEKIHQVRKRCKKLRGLLRLFRPPLVDTYATENAFLRDTARALSGTRDAQTLLNTCEQLQQRCAAQLSGSAFESIHEQLQNRCRQVLDDMQQVEAPLAATRARLREVSDRIGDWKLDPSPRKARDNFHVLSAGLATTYQRAREAMHTARETPTAESFHEWRKRVKYHWYHCRLLYHSWPKLMTARAAEAKRLGEWLGTDHDLAVLHQTISQAPDEFGSGSEVELFLSIIDHRRQKLQHQGMLLGKCLFAEKAKRFVKRQQIYWYALA